MATDTNYGDTPEDKAKAQAQGWVPLAQWKGDPAKHISAREFNDRAETYLPAIKSLLHKKNEEYQRDTAELRRRLDEQQAEFNKRLSTTEAMAQDALARQHQQHLAALEQKKLQYVPPEQRPGYMQVIDEQNKFFEDVAKTNNSSKAATSPQPASANNAPHPEVVEWIKRTPWIGNQTLFGYAQALGDKLGRENPNMPVREQLDYIEREVTKRYPDIMSVYGIEVPKDEHNEEHFNSAPQQRRSSSAAVESGSTRNVSGNKQKGWRDIPREDQDVAYRNFIKGGMYGKDESVAKETYAKSYWRFQGE